MMEILSRLAGNNIKKQENYMKLTGAIFDMDGTIMDSMVIWHNVGEKYLELKGLTPHKNFNKTFLKMSIIDSAKYFISDYGIEGDVDSIVAEINSLVEDFYRNEAELKPGILDMLTEMKKQGIKMAVATATDKYLVEIALKRNNIYELFDCIYTCTEVGADKNVTTIYDRSLDALGTEKSSTFVFEDSYHAIQTAKRGNYTVVGIADEYAKQNENEIRELSDIYIDNTANWRNYITL